MCDNAGLQVSSVTGARTIPVSEAVGSVLAHDITEIRAREFKGTAFRKGHVVRQEDVCHLQRLGKEHLFVLSIGDGELHENDAAVILANALKGDGVLLGDEPREGKVSLIAGRDGLLKVSVRSLYRFNMLADVMCASLHTNTVVRKGQVIAATRVIPLVVKKDVVEKALKIAGSNNNHGVRGTGDSLASSPEWLCQDAGESRHAAVIEVKEIRRPRAGIVITGSEIYYGKVRDSFAPIIAGKIKEFGGEITGIYYVPDNVVHIQARLQELLDAGADLLILTGGMSVDPDDVTRFAVRNLGAENVTYGSAVLPGAMVMVAYVGVHHEGVRVDGKPGGGKTTSPQSLIPVLGVPACGMYHTITVFDLVLPRVLAGEVVGRAELARLGHGGLCLNCAECRYPACAFGK